MDQEYKMVKKLQELILKEQQEAELKISAFKSGTLTKADLAKYYSFEKVDGLKTSINSMVTSLNVLENDRIKNKYWLSVFLELSWKTSVAWFIMFDSDFLSDDLFMNLTMPYFAMQGNTLLINLGYLSISIYAFLDDLYSVLNQLLISWNTCDSVLYLSIGQINGTDCEEVINSFMPRTKILNTPIEFRFNRTKEVHVSTYRFVMHFRRYSCSKTHTI